MRLAVFIKGEIKIIVEGFLIPFHGRRLWEHFEEETVRFNLRISLDFYPLSEIINAATKINFRCFIARSNGSTISMPHL